MNQVSFHPTTQSRFIDQLESAFRDGDPKSQAKDNEARNVRALIEQYQAIARGDFTAAIGTWHDEIEFEMIGPSGSFMSGCSRGKNEVAAAVARNFAALEDQEAEVVSLVAQGDSIALFAREKGKVRATGKSYECHWVQIYTFAGDKVKKLRSLIDPAFHNAAI